MKKEIYLDNSATTKPTESVIKAVTDALKKYYGNPSSLHSYGIQAEKIINNSRCLLADYLNINPVELIFTSGGTESNNLAIQGITKAYQQRGKHLITSPIEHASVNNVFLNLAQAGWDIDFVKVNKKGQLDLDHLNNLIRDDTVLVSLMQVNNELGTVNNLAKIANIIKNKNPLTLFHSDGVQGFAKIYTDLANIPIDLYSISGHKFHAPKGIGALYLKSGIELQPIFKGGGQENKWRSGTENVPAIAGLGAALKELPHLNSENKLSIQLTELKNYLIKELTKIDSVIINSPQQSAPHIINFSVPGIRGETMVHALAAQGVYLATGSACSSKSKGSRILKACGLDSKLSESALRVSLAADLKQADLDYFISSLKEQIDFLKLF
jgi:cysteine desulfurase